MNFKQMSEDLKIRGVYSTQAEAEFRCKMLREVDPNHNVLCRSSRYVDALGTRGL